MTVIGLISDTHGRLPDEALAAMADVDHIIHAGDIGGPEILHALEALAPTTAVLGNNDYYRDYGPDVARLCEFDYEGLHFAVAHYQEDLPVAGVDVAVCGHTHRSKIERSCGRLLINPGSATLPRGTRTPSIARLYVGDGAVMSAEIIPLK